MAGVPLLYLDGVGRTGRNTRVLDWVDSLILLDLGAASALVCDVVFRAGTSAFTVSCVTAYLRLRLCLSFVSDLWLRDGASKRGAFSGSTLGTAHVGTLGTCCVFCVINLVGRRLSSPRIRFTDGAAVENILPAMVGSCWNAASVSCRICCISSALFLLPMPVIAFAQ